jgi:hypothetical protein
MKEQELLLYSRLITLRNLLKEVQQLSWDITQLDKKYPPEMAKETEAYESLISVYLNFNDRIQGIAHEFHEAVIDDEIIEEIKMKSIKQNENKSSTH